VNHQHTIERIIKANPIPNEDLLHPDPAEAADLYGSIVAKRDNTGKVRTRGLLFDKPRPAPWYRRPQVVFAAAALVVAAIMFPVAVLSRSDDNRDPSGPVIASTAANGGPAVELNTAELLKVEDLPAGFDWAHRPLSDDWMGESEGHLGIRLALCDDLLDFVFDPPVGELQGRRFASFHAPAREAGTVTVDQMVYADSTEAVKSAYHDIQQRITDCVDDPTQWRQPRFDGDRIHGSILSIPTVGDEGFAVSYTTMTKSLRGYHRLAVMRHGDRLTIVEASEGLIPRTAPAELGRAEFEAILWQAVAYRGADEDCTGFCPSDALLDADDLPDTFNWLLEPDPEWFDGPGIPTVALPALCPDLFDLAARPPLSDLRDHVTTSLVADPRPSQGSLHIQQIAYTDSEAAISAAFDDIRQQLTSCVDNPDRWGLVTPEGRADGWTPRAGHLPMTPIGDDLTAIQVALYNTNDQGVWFDDRLAMVRQGKWLTIVVLSEGMPRNQIFTDDEFDEIVRIAIDLLSL
jgi:hypothetical protein